MSVPNYTAAKWAETAGGDVAVVGDSPAMTALGHPSIIPAAMDMMVMHAAAIRGGTTSDPSCLDECHIKAIISSIGHS